MSMKEYGTFGRGLVIPDNLIEYVATHSENWDQEVYENDFSTFFEENRMLGGKQVLSFTECSGDFFDIDDLHYIVFDEYEINEESFYIIEMDKYPSLFAQAYKDLDEIVEEFKSAVGKYFPDDFDYQKYLVSYHGTYWG